MVSMHHCKASVSDGLSPKIEANWQISLIEFLHSKHILHRDVKPENFLVGRGSLNTCLYLVDFGLAKRYFDSRKQRHVKQHEGKKLCGTARFASIPNHWGTTQSRRDDLESLAYTLIYFCRGSLPWQGTTGASRRQLYDRIMEHKLSIPLHDLCANIPSVYMTFLSYVRRLGFEERPDYSYIQKLFLPLINGGDGGFCEYEWMSEEHVDLFRPFATTDLNRPK